MSSSSAHAAISNISQLRTRFSRQRSVFSIIRDQPSVLRPNAARRAFGKITPGTDLGLKRIVALPGRIPLSQPGLT